MSYRQEARRVKQEEYGGYCNLCYKLNIEPCSYTSFEENEYNRAKELWKEKKKKQEQISKAVHHIYGYDSIRCVVLLDGEEFTVSLKELKDMMKI